MGIPAGARRAHLIMNPQARGVTPALVHLIRAALQSRLDLEVVETHARDAAIGIAREAAAGGSELVIAFGGDGLVNEVLNGMAGSEATLAIIPGGTMNVLARNLGIPRRPIEAADFVLNVLGRFPARRLTLGRANGRIFGLVCGCGFDASVAAIVENHRDAKRRYGEPYFYAAAVAKLATSFWEPHPPLVCEGAFGSLNAAMAIASTGGPYAYLGRRPVRLGPARDPDTSLDLFAMRRLEPGGILRYAYGTWTGRFGRQARSIGGLSDLRVRSDQAFPVHVDGEALPASREVTICLAEQTVPVLANPRGSLRA